MKTKLFISVMLVLFGISLIPYVYPVYIIVGPIIATITCLIYENSKSYKQQLDL